MVDITIWICKYCKFKTSDTTLMVLHLAGIGDKCEAMEESIIHKHDMTIEEEDD